jgi:hypothetical protein
MVNQYYKLVSLKLKNIQRQLKVTNIQVAI